MVAAARDVTQGQCFQGHPALEGPDLATGYGLADAAKAALLAKVRCLGLPRGPIIPNPIVTKAPAPRRALEPLPGPAPSVQGPIELEAASLERAPTPLSEEEVAGLERMLREPEAGPGEP
jgi:hypothetical protein